MTRRIIEGEVFVIAGDVDTDAVLAPRHLGQADPADLARNCFADLHAAAPFEAGRYRLVIATGLFGLGLVRPPVPLALKAAGIEAVIAPSLSPLFFEHGLNAGAVLPLEGALPRVPATGERVSLALDGELAELSWPGDAVAFACRMPAWALERRSLIDTLRQRADAAGGLAALQDTLRSRA